MATFADADWICEERRREVYELSEARWSAEGADVAAFHTRPRLNILKTWFGKLTRSLNIATVGQSEDNYSLSEKPERST